MLPSHPDACDCTTAKLNTDIFLLKKKRRIANAFAEFIWTLGTEMSFKMWNDASTSWFVAIRAEIKLACDWIPSRWRTCELKKHICFPSFCWSTFFRASVSLEKITPCMAPAPSRLPLPGLETDLKDKSRQDRCSFPAPNEDKKKRIWSLFFSVLTPWDAWAGVIKRVRKNESSFYGADCSLNGSFQKVKKVPSPARIGRMCLNNLQLLLCSYWSGKTVSVT